MSIAEDAQNAIEMAELIIEQSLEVTRAPEKQPDPAVLDYHQGRKDAARVILLSFTEHRSPYLTYPKEER